MILKRTLFLGAFTPRSQAYAQTIANADIKPEHCILFGEESGKLLGQTKSNIQNEKIENLFTPDFKIPLSVTAKENDWSTEVLKCTSINDELILEKVKQGNYDLVIFSGYGSQLVGKDLLRLKPDFLHVHAGWLPKFRGSTTVFYSIIEEGQCGVTAFFLNEEIDEGIIVGRKNYSMPSAVDIDYNFDSVIRANLLKDCLLEKIEKGNFPLNEKQTPGGASYYIIHPVLKHLAILKCEQGKK